MELPRHGDATMQIADLSKAGRLEVALGSVARLTELHNIQVVTSVYEEPPAADVSDLYSGKGMFIRVIAGAGLLTLPDASVPLKLGDCAFIPRATCFRMQAINQAGRSEVFRFAILNLYGYAE